MEIPPQPDQNIDQNISTPPTQHEIDQAEIPQLQTDPKEDQLQDLQTYLTHHNTYEESQRIHSEYRARLLELDDNRYYQEIDSVCVRPTDHSQHGTIYQQTRLLVLAV